MTLHRAHTQRSGVKTNLVKLIYGGARMAPSICSDLEKSGIVTAVGSEPIVMNLDAKLTASDLKNMLVPSTSLNINTKGLIGHTGNSGYFQKKVCRRSGILCERERSLTLC